MQELDIKVTQSKEIAAELEYLRDELSTCKIENTELSSSLADFRHRLHEQELRAGQKDEKIASLLENMQEMEERLTQISFEDAESGKSELGTKEHDLISEIQMLKKTVEEKEFKFTKALATAKKIKVQLNKTRDELEKVTFDKEALSKELNDTKIKADLESSVFAEKLLAANVESGEIKESVQEMEQPDQEKDQTEKLIQDLQAQCQTYAEFSQQLQGQVQNLTETQHASDKMVKQMEEHLAQFSQEKESLQKSVQEKDELLSRMGHNAEDLKQSIKHHNLMLEEKSQMNELLQEELGSMTESLHNIRNTATASPSEELRNQLSETERQLKECKAIIESLNEQIQSTQLSYKESKQQFGELLEQNTSYENTIQVLQKEMKSNITQRDEYKQQLDDSLKQNEESRRQLEVAIDQHQKIISTKNDCIDAKEAAIETLRNKSTYDVENLTTVISENDMKIKQSINTIQELIDSNQEKETRNSSLETELKCQNDKLESLKMDSILKQSEIEQIIAAVAILENEKEGRIQLIQSLQTDVTSAAAELDQSKTTLSQQENEILVLNEHISSFKNQAADLVSQNEQINSLQLQLNSKESELDDTQNEMQMMHDNLVELKSELTNVVKINETMQRENEKMVQESDQMRENMSTLLAEDVIIKGAIEVKDNEIRGLSASVTQLQDICTSKEKELNDATQIRLSHETEVSSMDNIITTLQIESLKSLVEENETVKKKLGVTESLQAEISQLIQANQQLSTHGENIKESMENLRSEKQSLFDDLSAIQDENESLKLNLEKYEKEKNESVSERNNELTEQLSCLTVTITNLRKENDELQYSLDSFSSENSEMNQSLDAVRNQMSDTHDKFLSLKTEHDLLKNQFENLNIDYSRLIEEKSVLENHVQTLEQMDQTTIIETPQDEGSWEEAVLVREEMQMKSEPIQEAMVSEAIDSLQTQPLCQNIDIARSNTGREIEILQQQLNEVKQEKESTTEAYDKLNAKFEKLLAKLKIFKERNDNYQSEIAELKQQMSASERTDQSEKDHLQHKCELLQNQISDMERETKEAVETNQQQAVLNQILKKDMEIADSKIQQLQVSLEETETNRNYIKQEHHTAKRETEDIISKLKSEHIQAQNRSVELLEEIDSLNASLAETNELVDDLTSDKEVLEEQITNLVSQVFGDKTKSVEKDQVLIDLKQKLHDTELLVEDIKHREEIAQRKVTDFKEQYEMLEKDNEQFQSIVQKTGASNTELKQDNIRQKMKIEKLENELKESVITTKKADSLEKELADAETEKGYLEEEMDGLRGDLIHAKQEKTDALADSARAAEHLGVLQIDFDSKNHEIEGLKWKLDEMVALDEEIKFERKEKEHLQISHTDLENKLLKSKSTIDELNAEVHNMNESIELLESKTKCLDELDSKLQQSVTTIHERDNVMDVLKQQMEVQQTAAIDRIHVLQENLKAMKSEHEVTKTDNAAIKKQADKTNKQLQKFELLKHEYEALTEEYNKVITDNRGFAKQIEELHSKLKDFSTKNQSSDDPEKAHLQKSKTVLSNRIDQLETECASLRSQCSELNDNKSKLEHSIQHTEFERDSLKAQKQATSADDQSTSFHNDYSKVQQQFSIAMQQKNKLQTELNMAQKSLAQRDARCQQLAAQVRY